ncbi:MAG: hypothetical protein IJY14_02325 [Acholeplasmatales bacterium]|nr:hypothetical protein [Acholeplasmatales bacterium]
MGYSIEFKNSVIEDYKKGIVGKIEDYVISKGISKTTFYKWIKEINIKNDLIPFIDITSSVVNNSSSLLLQINNINIEINDNYNESLLLNVIRTLNKL